MLATTPEKNTPIDAIIDQLDAEQEHQRIGELVEELVDIRLTSETPTSTPAMATGARSAASRQVRDVELAEEAIGHEL